ncbi:MAG: SHOCT domain-containing protein, partial [Microbacterium sp.]
FLTALVYLIARGSGMQKRSVEQYAELRKQQDAYIRSAAGSSSPTDDIAKAKGLLDSGAISEAEFAALKTKALAG